MPRIDGRGPGMASLMHKMDLQMTQLRVFSIAATGAGVALALALGGCASKPVQAPLPKNDVRSALEESMARVDKMPTHSRSADAKAPEANLRTGLITIRSYQNEAAKLLTRVAAARGMKFSVQGPEPRLPLFVSIDVENVTFEELLTEVGHQFGQRADIVLTNDAIAIRYRGM